MVISISTSGPRRHFDCAWIKYNRNVVLFVVIVFQEKMIRSSDIPTTFNFPICSHLMNQHDLYYCCLTLEMSPQLTGTFQNNSVLWFIKVTTLF